MVYSGASGTAQGPRGLSMASVQDERLARQVEVGGVRLELFEFGSGKPILVLHEGQGFSPDAAFVGGLAKSHRVIAPSHPGFGRSERPGDIDTVDDLAHLYLEFIHDFGLHEVTVLGFSLGGWIAAEVAPGVPTTSAGWSSSTRWASGPVSRRIDRSSISSGSLPRSFSRRRSRTPSVISRIFRRSGTTISSRWPVTGRRRPCTAGIRTCTTRSCRADWPGCGYPPLSCGARTTESCRWNTDARWRDLCPTDVS